jgi:hypothetical protein
MKTSTATPRADLYSRVTERVIADLEELGNLDQVTQGMVIARLAISSNITASCARTSR